MAELQSHLLIAHRLSFVRGRELKTTLRLCDGISRMLSGLSSALAKHPPLARAPNTGHRTPPKHPTPQ
jgi:hypothetical protein